MQVITTRSTRNGKRRAIAVDDDWEQEAVTGLCVDICQTVPRSRGNADKGLDVVTVPPTKLFVVMADGSTVTYACIGYEVEPDAENVDVIKRYTVGERIDE